MDWKSMVRAYVKDITKQPAQPIEKQEQFEEHYSSAIQEHKNAQVLLEPSLKEIPRFYITRSLEGPEPHNRLFNIARNNVLNQSNDCILDHEKFEDLWNIISLHLSDDNQERLNYEAFCMVGDVMNKKYKSAFSHLFTPQVFTKFGPDQYGRISAATFFDYIQKRSIVERITVNLCYYDVLGQGFLREKDLELYIFELIDSIPKLNTLNKGFFPFYVSSAVRKFFFFMDPNRTGKIKIDDLALSPIMNELEDAIHTDLSPLAEAENWFTARSALNVYGIFASLDTDKNGRLGKNDVVRYNGSLLTETFVNELFQNIKLKKGEMEYKAYLDFVLAMKHKNTPQGMSYFFKILDVQKKGYLTVFNINYFFKDIMKRLRQEGADIVPVEDVRDEIFDMVKPHDLYHITLKDLLRSGMGATVIGILIDLQAFSAYDNRESLTPKDDDDEENS